jgi:hypothetical protein
MSDYEVVVVMGQHLGLSDVRYQCFDRKRKELGRRRKKTHGFGMAGAIAGELCNVRKWNLAEVVLLAPSLE